jgi:hypothetical protein
MQSLQCPDAIITLHVCMRSRGEAVGLSVVSSVVCRPHTDSQNSRSRHRKRNELVEIVEKPASLCFELFDKAHKHSKYIVLLVIPINRTPMCFVHMHAHNLA